MASIFTFDPDPPRVSSPWATPPGGSTDSPKAQQDATPPKASTSDQAPVTEYTSITRLEAEPQEGPTEYKLHLLLRRRRSFTRATTGLHVTGSLRRAESLDPVPVSRGPPEPVSNTPPLSSTQSRQHRLEQLTTQLLWRLQQSCPYHISSSTAPLLPHLPADARLSAPEMPHRLLPGLEESKGALYEIGVADDGTIVGLAEDEMDESLNNLRAMAASLGCRVEVLRMVPVGECEWTEAKKVHASKLLVAEALIRPDQHLVDHTKEAQVDVEVKGSEVVASASVSEPQTAIEQLRVSLIGATMSGKSSLLGTLSTATLDNGRGKSRLSLLKHRHEIASGMTSSVTQELLGFRDVIENGETDSTQVISYGSGDVSSWIDIHAAVEAADKGRLIVLSDSAGHPRFRRTTVRGIVGWQPHWTLVCIPADSTDDSSGKLGASPTPQELLGPAAADLDLSQAHLQLCLNLELPLVVIITKYDLATKAGLRQTLSKLLSALKEAGRRPCIISDPSSAVLEADLQTISAADLQEAGTIAATLSDLPLSAVPIIFTSAVKGTGITKLHAFLRQLPLPPQPTPPSTSPPHLFFIEDVYSTRTPTSPSASHTAIIGGYLRHGHLTIGDELVLGPYPLDPLSDDSDSSSPRRTPPHPTSRSFPGALTARAAPATEWRPVRITSLRNLRLPVRSLLAGQLGTVGLAPVAGPPLARIRRGMVLASRPGRAARGLAIRFEGAQAVGAAALGAGCAVVVYVASVRASARVVGVVDSSVSVAAAAPADAGEDDDAFGFGFEDDAPAAETPAAPSRLTVSLQFLAAREFVELGARALVMPGGGPGLTGGTERGAKGVAGLEGFVGEIVECG